MQSVPPGSVCGSGWLVFEVLLPSSTGGLGGTRALWFTAADCLLGQDLLGTGPPGLQGPASLTGCPLSEALCLLSLWSLVSDLSPAPPSPSPPLSLSLFLYFPPLPSLYPPNSLVPPPSPSSPPFLLYLLSYVDGQGHSHGDLSSSAPRGSLAVPWAAVREISRA